MFVTNCLPSTSMRRSRDTTSEITAKARVPDWDALVALLPRLDSPGTGGVADLYQAIYDTGIVSPFDWASWQHRGRRLHDDPSALAAATLPALRKLVTMHMRLDRFVEGHFESVVASGHMAAVIRRIAELKAGGSPTQLEDVDVAAALPLIRRGLEAYLWLQANLLDRDVSADVEYQRRFAGFYRIRYGMEWRRHFFSMLEERKRLPVAFGSVLRDLHAATGRVEASFASKLAATIDPSLPVIDSVVLRNLGLRLPKSSDPGRLEGIVHLHAALHGIMSGYLTSPAGEGLVAKFMAAYPNACISPMKMLDLILWQTREA